MMTLENQNSLVTLELTYGAVADSISEIPSVLKGLTDPEDNELIDYSELVSKINDSPFPCNPGKNWGMSQISNLSSGSGPFKVKGSKISPFVKSDKLFETEFGAGYKFTFTKVPRSKVDDLCLALALAPTSLNGDFADFTASNHIA